MKGLIDFGSKAIVISIPTIWGKLINFLTYKNIEIHTLISCGEPLSKRLGISLADLITTNCLNMYGATEFATWVFYFDIKKTQFNNASKQQKDEMKSSFVPIGKPLGDIKYRLEENNVLYICTGSPKTQYIQSTGIHSGPELIVDEKGDRYDNTGDRACVIDKDKNVECMGRLNGLQKISGAFVDTYRINNLLYTINNKIKAIAMVHSNTYLLIIIECKAQLFTSELKTDITRQIREFTTARIPIIYIREETFKLNRSGKVDSAYYQRFETKSLLQLTEK